MIFAAIFSVGLAWTNPAFKAGAACEVGDVFLYDSLTVQIELTKPGWTAYYRKAGHSIERASADCGVPNPAGDTALVVYAARIRTGRGRDPAAWSCWSNGVMVAAARYVPKADLNSDGAVNVADFAIWTEYQAEQNPAGDLNGDGVMNVADAGIFAEEQAAQRRPLAAWVAGP